jgi:hypothetical protein
MLFRGVAQLASALAWGARGRLFESDHPDEDRMRVCSDADPLSFNVIFKQFAKIT